MQEMLDKIVELEPLSVNIISKAKTAINSSVPINTLIVTTKCLDCIEEIFSKQYSLLDIGVVYVAFIYYFFIHPIITPCLVMCTHVLNLI